MSGANRILPLFIPHLGCPHNCVFCDQRRISGAVQPVTAEDVTAAITALPPACAGAEAAFYGGSFTALPLSEQAALLGAVQPFLERGTISGIRLSTRPDAITPQVLELLARYHVNTVELGAQSMDDAVLQRSGRGHRAADTENAAQALRQRGFHLILQMMTGLPGSSFESDRNTAEALAALHPDGVRVYPTVIIRGTPLETLWREGNYREHTVEDAVALCAELLPVFQQAGIPVIRLGLNPTEELSGGEAVGGAYHPAFGELVRSRMYLNRARTLLCPEDAGRDVTLGVCPRELSQMIGQHRSNIAALIGEYHLRSLRILPEKLDAGELIRIE